MATPINVLVLEDHAPDAELIIRELREAGFDPRWRHVETEEQFLTALDSAPDVVLADYHLPRFTGMLALQLIVERGLDIPLIIVTGTLGDERTADCFKLGASDYVHKDRLKRLGPAVTRALAEAHARRDQRNAEEQLRSMHEQLRRSELRLALAMEASSVGPWDWDLRTNDVFYSPEWKRQIGYRDEEIGNRFSEWADRLHPDDRDRTIAAAQACARGEAGKYDVEFQFRHKDGSYRWIQTRATLVRDDTGTPVRMLGCHVDVTDRRREQLERERLARTIQLLLDSTGEGVYGVDNTGHCTFINRAAARTLGWSPPEVVGKSMHELIHHTHPDGSVHVWAECPIRRTREAGTPCRVDDDVFWRKDGTSFSVGYSAYPVMDGSGVAGAVVTFADVTERRALEAQLRQSQKLEAIGRLTGGVAHDFNNLLTAVLGNCEFLLEELPRDDPHTAEVNEIRRAGESAAALTRQLLAFSRQQVLQPQVLDLNGVVTSTEKLLRRVIGEDVGLSVALDPALWRVSVDPHQLEQVLLNLAVNARDAMPDGGRLTIETSNAQIDGGEAMSPHLLGPGRYVALKVSDNGIGMSEDVKARIFEPFFTTKGPGKGTGLGLSTVLGIVEQSGGRVDVASEPGAGSTFTIYLPATEKLPEPARPPVAVKPRPANQEVVLLVDDDTGIRGLARTVLERAGYTVRTAENADHALATDPSQHVDILVTDIVLPAMNGKLLAAALRERWPALRVLYVSGYTGTAFLDGRAIQPGEAFLAKPFTPTALKGKIREVLDGG